MFGLFLASSWSAWLLHAIYLLLMARYLGVEAYGLLLSLMSVFALASLPAAGLDMLAARTVAGLPEGAPSGPALRRVAVVCTTWGIAAATAILVLTPVLAGALDIEQTGLIALTAAAVLCSYLQAFSWGILRGRRRFLLLSCNLLLYPGLRVGLGLLLVLGGLGVLGALLATLASVALTAALAASTLVTQRFATSQRQQEGARPQSPPSAPDPTTHYAAYSLTASAVTVALALPGTLDVIVARATTSSQLAGLYSMAATLGKAGIMAATSVSLFTFPKIVARMARSEKYTDLVALGLVLSAAVSSAIGLGLGLLAPTIIPLVFGENFLSGLGLLRWYLVAAIPFSLVVVLAHLQVAIFSSSSVRRVLLFAVLLAGAMLLAAGEPHRLVLSFAAVSSAFLLWSSAHMVRPGRGVGLLPGQR